MPINPNEVQWDSEPIDINAVQWDEPSRPDFSNVQTRVTSTGSERKKKQTAIGDLMLGRKKHNPLVSLGAKALEQQFRTSDAFLHGVGNFFHGSAQTVENALAKAADLGVGRGGALISPAFALLGEIEPARRYIRKEVDKVNSELAQRERDYQARRVPGAATTVGEIGGAVAPWLVGGPAKLSTGIANKLAPAGSGLFKRAVGAAGSGVVIGGLAGAAEPVIGDDYAKTKAGQIGVGAGVGLLAGPVGQLVGEAGAKAFRLGISGVNKLAGAAKRGKPTYRDMTPEEVKNAGLPEGTIAQVEVPAAQKAPPLSLAERRAGEILRREAGTSDLPIDPSKVQGYVRPLGEETQLPGVMQLEDYLRVNKPEAFRAIDEANNLANLSVLQRMGGTNAQMEAAKLARAEASQKFYNEAMAGGDIDLSSTVRQLGGMIDDQAGRDAIQPALEKIRSNILRLARAGDEPVYHRYTKSPDSPDNGAGYMMFSDDQARVSNAYGGNHWVASVPKNGAIDVRSPEFKKAVSDAARDEIDSGYMLDDYINSLENPESPDIPERLASSFSPEEIVNSADAWDNPSLVEWYWDKVAQPKNWMTAITPNGLVTFDKSIVRKGAGDAGPAGVMLSPKRVDNIRKDIGDMLSGRYGDKSAKALAGSRELIAARDALVGDAGAQRPAFASYVNAFREMSRPINQMQIGRTLLKKSSSTAMDRAGNPILLPNQYIKAMGDMDGIAAKATNFNKAKASDIVTPQMMGELNAVMDNLRRQAAVTRSNAVGNSATAGRSDVASRVNGTGGAGANFAKRAAYRAIPKVGEVADFIEKELGKETVETLAYLVANPAQARRVLQGMSKQDRSTITNVLTMLNSGSKAAPIAAGAVTKDRRKD